MPRPKKLRADLEQHGVMLNEYGVELGRLTLNGILVLNLTEIFYEVERWSVMHGNKCSYNHLCAVFSRTGSWGYDPSVYAAIDTMIALGTLEHVDDKHVRTCCTAREALTRLPEYVSRAELHAGLEEIND